MDLKYRETLAPHTYFKLGGPADQFVEVKTVEELVEAVRYAIAEKLPYLVLGGGSNVLISDKGFRGLVILNRTSGIRLKGFAGGVEKGKVNLKEVIVEADSGVPANLLIRYTLDQGLAGLENMLGLPGTVGGAVYNNSHHLKDLFGDHILEVQILDKEGKIKKYTHNDCHFAYDSSIFHKTNEVILSATFQLERGNKEALWQQANAAVSRRATTQPLGSASSGCMFRNISLADSLRLGAPTQSVGYLIDKAGLKLARVGGAYVSDKHANFIVNDGTATSRDVLDLVALIKRKIKSKYNVRLVPEVFLIGEK